MSFNSSRDRSEFIFSYALKMSKQSVATRKSFKTTAFKTLVINMLLLVENFFLKAKETEKLILIVLCVIFTEILILLHS